MNLEDAPVWATSAVSVEWRRQQEDALNALTQALTAGNNRAWVSLPPGAGKTLVGLEMARRLGVKTVAFSPNTAIQSQWHKAGDLFTPALPIGKSRLMETPITALTYQSIAQFVTKEGTTDSQFDRLHENGRKIITDLAAEPRVLIILDEAHHLLAAWGQLMAEILEMLPNATVIGLTGTPPTMMTDAEASLMDRVLGGLVYEASPNALVRDRAIAPYQDLNYFVTPTLDETMYVAGTDSKKNADRAISHSLAKAGGAVRILQAEWESRREDLRALVLCDYETLSAKADDFRPGSAENVIRRLNENALTKNLLPVLVTGSRVTCARITAHIISEWVSEYRPEIMLDPVPEEGDLYDIVNISGAWTSLEWVSVITQWFQTDLGHILVGTRSLLGEGWDAPATNVVIDLTTAATTAAVAQGRGRGLRIDKNNPRKVANLWSVTTVDPFTPDYSPDYDRLLKKAQAYFTIFRHKQIVRGDVAIPTLEEILENQSALNDASLASAANYDSVYDLWKVGHEYRDTKSRWIDIPNQSTDLLRLRLLGSKNIGYGIDRNGFFTTPRVRRGLFRKPTVEVLPEPASKTTVQESIAMAVAETLHRMGLISNGWKSVKVIRFPDVTRFWFETDNDEEADLFRSTLAECFDLSVPADGKHFPAHGVKRSDYERITTNTKNAYFTPVTSFHPIPRLFLKKRATTDLFENVWTRLVGTTVTRCPGWTYEEWQGETSMGETWH